MNTKFWQEEIDEAHYAVPDDVVDLIFKIQCRTLPVDHAWALSEAVHRLLPWFPGESRSGLHLIHGADSGNGWERPANGDEPLYLSRRTPLILRLPKERIGDARALTGNTLDIAGSQILVGESHPRPLGLTTTLYSRYLVTDKDQTEDEFLQSAIDQLQALKLHFKKVLCGKGARFSTPQGALFTQSLMVAGLTLDDAVRLQEQGLGPLRSRGFGLFVPHKTV
ncbi:MAG: type I-MYXAN CRISPR-associated protein Cas6/Cmx6 [Candidatus Thiodiazotropha sp. (ex Dulcina madagascariensis)]|nr:type I-MYXAN CRISPR-associated protein Cas6/Cmx6 [Candidatus Thiodiazotropha sp. (ex Dulcina madagascariensis)]